MASTPAAQSPQRDLLFLLPWLASLLLLLYGVGVIGNVIPLQLTSPQWQLRLCEALINQAPLVLMGLALAVIGHRWTPDGVVNNRILGWTRRAALPLTLAFALLIPLQGAASLEILQTTNRNSAALIAATDRNLKAARQQINQARSSAELAAMAEQLPTRLPPLEQLGSSFGAQQQQLLQVLDQLRGRTVLQVQLNRQQQQTLLLRNSVRLTLVAALLACLFQQARPQRQARPVAAQRQRQTQPRQQTLAADLARYCNGNKGGRG